MRQATAALTQLDGWITAQHSAPDGAAPGEEDTTCPPEWLIQQGLNRANVVAVHTAGSWTAARRTAPRRVGRYW